MRSVTWHAHGFLLSLCIPLCLAAAPADVRAQVYKWVDENGETHYMIERLTDGTELRKRLREAEADPIVEVEALRPDFGPEGPLQEPDFAPRPDLETPIPPEELAPAPAPTVLAREAPEAAEPVEPLIEEAPRASPPETPETVAPSEPPADDVYPQLAQNSKRIAELEAEIERDREALRRMISEGTQQGLDLARDPKVREIAERLPRLHEELAQLRGQNR